MWIIANDTVANSKTLCVSVCNIQNFTIELSATTAETIIAVFFFPINLQFRRWFAIQYNRVDSNKINAHSNIQRPHKQFQGIYPICSVFYVCLMEEPYHHPIVHQSHRQNIYISNLICKSCG